MLTLVTRIVPNYLDTHIQIERHRIESKVYDKRDSFNFDIIKILHFSSNVHILIFQNIFKMVLNVLIG